MKTNRLTRLKKQFKSINKGFKAFLVRLVIFLIIFKVVGFFYIPYKEYLGHSFYTVTNSYISNFLFFVVALTLIFRKEKIKKIPRYKHSILQSLIFAPLAILFFSLDATLLAKLYTVQHEMVYFALYTAGHLAVFLAIFNLKFLTKFLNEEFLFIFMMMMIIMTSYLIINKNWGKFFWPISESVKLVLPLFDPNVEIFAIKEGFSINIQNFRVNVGPPCAGIYSMIAFSLLYLTAIFFAKKHRNINKNMAILAYIGGVSLMYVLNIFRICVIILVGAFYSRDLAIDLFHEYLSAIFLMAIFLIFLNKIIPRISKAKSRAECE